MTQAQQLHPQGTAEDEVTSQFYIPAVSSLQERRLRALKHGDSFALFNHYGDIVPFRGAPDGLYHCDTRYLSHLELRLNGQQPLLLSSTFVSVPSEPIVVDAFTRSSAWRNVSASPRSIMPVMRMT